MQKKSNLPSVPLWQHFCILLSLGTWFVCLVKGPLPPAEIPGEQKSPCIFVWVSSNSLCLLEAVGMEHWEVLTCMT